MALEQKEVPLELRRRAAQHLESIRGTPMAPRAEGARLGREVWPIHRPASTDVAYYEFSVETSSGGQRLSTSAAACPQLIAAQRGSQGERAVGKGACLRSEAPAGAGRVPGTPARAALGGSSSVTNGRHDFPVPHWSLERPPVSAQLAAAAEEGADGIERIYRLDSLAYVAEAKDGNLAARVGQTPPTMAGLPHDLARHRDANTTLIAEARGELKSGRDRRGVSTNERDGEGPPELKPVDVENWPDFRDRYRDVFGPFLDDLRRQASATWELEDAINEFGEGSTPGRAPSRAAPAGGGRRAERRRCGSRACADRRAVRRSSAADRGPAGNDHRVRDRA
jgi:hypothetical protein